MTPKRTVRGIRSPIPSGHLIGRSSLGEGEAELIPFTDIAQGVVRTGIVAGTGSVAGVISGADKTVVSNISGAASLPVNNTLTAVLDHDLGNTNGMVATRVGGTWTASFTTLITGVGTISTGVWQGTKVGLTYGGTNADLSATGGTSQVLKQVSSGAAVTVGQLAASDLSNGVTGSGAVVLASGPTITSLIVTGAFTATGLVTNADLSNSSLTIGSTSIALGATSTTLAGLTSVTTTGGSLTGLTGLAIRDTSAAFDVILAATSGTALTADRALTFNMGNVAHTLAFGTTANTITFPTSASYTVAGRGLTQSFTGTNTFTQQIISSLADGTAPFSIVSTTRVANLNVATAGAADTVTTNANLTGPITSVGNATSIASQTGTGTKFVVDTSPTLVTPVLGVATATSINKVTITQPAAGSTLTIADGKTLTDTSGVGAKLLLGATGGGFTGYAGVSSVSHKWIASLDTAGAGTLTQPATADLSDISTFNLSTSGTGSVASLAITGTAGAGYIDLGSQSSTPSSTVGSMRIYTQNGTNARFLSGTSGFYGSLLFSGLSANRVFTWPDHDGNIITSGDTGTVSNAMLANSSVTVGSTSIALGATSTSLAGLTTLSMNNQLTNTLAIGTAPFVITSTTRVSNLNVATAGNADTVTTNANLTGPVTSVGNATSLTSGLTLTDTIMSGYKVCTTQLDKTTDTTYAVVTGLSIALTAGATYVIRGWLSVTSGASGGLKAQLFAASSLSATSIRFAGIAWNGTTIVTNPAALTALGSNFVATNAIITDVYFTGSIVVNAAGTLQVRAAQNTSNGTTTSVFANSNFSCTRVA